ncbi:MAG: hypothetical protein Q8L10_05390 [Candidatus Moranbacteria bacterium]|nr:hypothetical protein [Candidatus Moranbacteria bacterium]
MSDIMDYFGVNQQELKNNIQNMNVSRQKKIPPQVSISFTPASPVPGEKITATATPTYFMNDPSQIYYTWLLKRSGKGGDAEDYKVAAMRIIASGDFEYEQESYADDGKKSAGDSDTGDSDGYYAFFGGQDQKGKKARCFAKDVYSGNDYEIPCKHAFPTSGPGEVGDGEFGLKEEEFWHTNPKSNDTANSGTMDEAAVAGLGKTTFSWIYAPGDKVGVIVEGISVDPTSYADSSYKTMWAMPKNTEDNCNDVDLDPLPENRTDTPVVTKTDYTDTDADGYEESYTKVTTTTSYSYAKGDYTVKTGESPGIQTLKTTKTTVTTQDCILPPASLFEPSPVEICGEATTPAYWPTSSSTANPRSVTAADGALDSSTDFNNCLEDNLVDPAQGTSNKKLDVSLSYLPSTPMNDPSGSNADELIIQSSILNAENRDFIHYDWSVSLGSSISADDWIALDANTKKQVGLGQTAGIGLKSLKMKLNFDKSEVFYAKITLRAKETSFEDLQKEGVATIVVPIYNIQNKLEVFQANVSTDLNIAVDAAPESKRCNSGIEEVLCPVVRNEIIGLRTDIDPSDYNLAWTLNGEPIQAENSNSSTAYFPVLQEKGTRYTVSLNASHKTSKEKIILTRIFAVADPEVRISAINESATNSTCLPVLLGYYVDPLNKNPNPTAAGGDDSLWPDYSEDSFEALQGKLIRLKVAANTLSLTQPAWIIDGTIVTADNAASFGATLDAEGNLSFPANKPLGATYSVGVETLYTQPNLVKKALYAKWGVPLTDFYEKRIGESITIKVTDQIDVSAALTARTQDKKILASLFSAIPAYVNFLFRIILTILLILFSTGLLFSFFPKQNQV